MKRVTRKSAARIAKDIRLSRNADLEQFRQGIEVEQEHTRNLHTAGKIAKDHLRELPDYYTRLRWMEKNDMPLAKTCSTSAMSKNVAREIRAGRSRTQAVAIAYATLKKSCGVKSEKRMTPKQIVSKKRRGVRGFWSDLFAPTKSSRAATSQKRVVNLPAGSNVLHSSEIEDEMQARANEGKYCLYMWARSGRYWYPAVCKSSKVSVQKTARAVRVPGHPMKIVRYQGERIAEVQASKKSKRGRK